MDPVSNSTSSSSLLQLMQMMQQMFAQNNVATNDPTSGADNSGTDAITTGTSNTNLISGSSPLSGDTLFVLMQSQGVAPSDSGSSSGQSGESQSGFGQDFQQLAQAIQSGNLSGAQSAYTTLSQLVDGNNQSQNTASGQANPFLTALNQIGSDLQSGDLTGAQQTLSSFGQQTQGHHHHHGEGSGGGNSGDAVVAIGVSDPSGLGTTGGTGSSTGGSTSSDSSTASTTVVSEIAETNADGSVTIITTNADGSQTTTNVPADQLAPNATSQTTAAQTASGTATPVANSSTANAGNTNQLQNLFSALEESLEGLG